MAENYLDGLLEGYTLEVEVNSIGKLNFISYLSFNENKRLKHIYLTMCAVIKLCGLNLKFEHEYEVWSSPPNESFCDLDYQVHENKDGGLLLCYYKTCDHVVE